jgi:hypothetical protein
MFDLKANRSGSANGNSDVKSGRVFQAYRDFRIASSSMIHPVCQLADARYVDGDVISD